MLRIPAFASNVWFCHTTSLTERNIKRFCEWGFYENFGAQILVKKDFSLHYYKPNDNSELEFVIEKDNEIIRIEVKAGNATTKSLDSFVKDYEPSIAIKLIPGNVGTFRN